MQDLVFYILDHSAAFLERWLWHDVTTFVVTIFYLWIPNLVGQLAEKIWPNSFFENRSTAFLGVMAIATIVFFVVVIWLMFEVMYWAWKRLPPLEPVDPWFTTLFGIFIIGVPSAIAWAIIQRRGNLRLAWLALIVSVAVFVALAAINPRSSWMTTIVVCNLAAIAGSITWLRYERKRERHQLRFPNVAEPHPLSANLASKSETRHPSQGGWREL